MSLAQLKKNPVYQISYARSVMLVALSNLKKMQTIEMSTLDQQHLEVAKYELQYAIDSLAEWVFDATND